MRRDGLARRLAATQLVVLASMGLAVAGAALVVGPPLFSGHMRASGHDMPGVAEHARQAFHDAGLLSLAIGLVVAVPIAVATSWAMNRRLVRGIDALIDGAARVSAMGGHGPVRIEVCDDGAGIAAGDLPHLFERFYRVDGSRVRDTDGGTGVGLAISRAIVAQHGGTLTAHSDGPGRGARFVVELPERDAED